MLLGVRKAKRKNQKKEKTETYVDQVGQVALTQVAQHGRLVQLRQCGHVLAFVVLGWVLRLHVVLDDRALL